MTDHTFGIVEGLNQKEPVVVILGNAAVGLGIDFVGRHDIENGEAFDRFAMMKRQTVRDTSASIMAADIEGCVSEMLYNGDLICRHFPFGIGRMAGIRAAFGFTTIAISTQIAGDNGKILRQTIHNLVPYDMGLRIPAQEQERERGPGTPGPESYFGHTGVDSMSRKIFKICQGSYLCWRCVDPACDPRHTYLNW